jgi:hypothetical protein
LLTISVGATWSVFASLTLPKLLRQLPLKLQLKDIAYLVAIARAQRQNDVTR